MKIIFDGGPLNGQEADMSGEAPDLVFVFYTVTREFLLDNEGNAFAETNKEPVKHKHTYIIDCERANYKGRELVKMTDEINKI